MFGYVTTAPELLTPQARERYRAYYCGLCRALSKRYGAIGRMTLSYDMTFLYLLLSSLYEPQNIEGTERCMLHPIKAHAFVCNELADYCCDMNIAVAYHKCLDDWKDERSLIGRAEAAMLKQAYDKVQRLHPEKCTAIEAYLQELGRLEKRNEVSPDAGANLTARMLGVLYRYREDLWADTLTRIGEGLGRFIYLMDAYDDLQSDLKHKRFNPLRAYANQNGYEAFIKETLTLLIAESTEAFETLPLVQDMDILRNILYAGCWTRYQRKLQQRERKSGVPAPGKERATQKEAGL